MARAVALMGYGKPEDRLRLEALAQVTNQSGSQWLIDTVRREYEKLYGTTDPNEVIKKDTKR